MKKLFLLLSAVFLSVVFLSEPTTLLAQNPTVSASKVTFKYCESSSSNVTLNALSLPVTWNGRTYNEEGIYVETIENARGCDSIVTLTVNDMQGAIPYPFTVAYGIRVYFSRGNLQYCAKPTSGPTTHTTADGQNKQGIWRFALNQWDFVGAQDVETGSYADGNVYENGVLCDNLKRGGAYTGWIDLFRRGTSGYSTYTPFGYGAYYTKTAGANLLDTYDWGKYNPITNGGNVPNKWRVLTSAEWNYLKNSRGNANALYAQGTVNNVYGVILLPDNWVLPEGCSFTPRVNTNTYTSEQWEVMEANGAVFLPAGGYVINHPYKNSQKTRYNKYEKSNTYYWTSTEGTCYSNSELGGGAAMVELSTMPFSIIDTYSQTFTMDLKSDFYSVSNSSYNVEYYKQTFLPVRLVCPAP